MFNKPTQPVSVTAPPPQEFELRLSVQVLEKHGDVMNGGIEMKINRTLHISTLTSASKLLQAIDAIVKEAREEIC